jgi:hypothetical protein
MSWIFMTLAQNYEYEFVVSESRKVAYENKDSITRMQTE